MAYYEYYYKEPTFQVYPSQNLKITLIHPIDNEYEYVKDFPFKIEITRRLKECKRYKVFDKSEIIVHHMSYVRKDIHKKYKNSTNQFYWLYDYLKDFDNYKLGQRVCLLPDYMNRKNNRSSESVRDTHEVIKKRREQC